MSALWAIVMDTWRQSRQQAVFIVMLVLLALITIGTVVFLHPFEEPGGENRVGFVTSDGPSEELETAWVMLYAQRTMLENKEPMDPFAVDPKERERQQEAMREAEAKTDVPLADRAVQTFLNGVAGFIFSISMILFLAASAGYIPNMLESGAIDMVLAKPVDRLRIYLAKFAGGLALYAAAIAATYFVIFVGVGAHTGVWVGRVFLVMPLQIFSAAVLFAIVAALGVVSRSSTLCLIVGLVFYIVVDTLIGQLIQLQQFGMLDDWPVLATTGKWMRMTLPNFGLLKDTATASVLNIPATPWQPLAVAFAWLVGSLGFGYWRFSRTDY